MCFAFHYPLILRSVWLCTYCQITVGDAVQLFTWCCTHLQEVGSINTFSVNALLPIFYVLEGAKPQLWGSRVICKETGNSGPMNFTYDGVGVRSLQNKCYNAK